LKKKYRDKVRNRTNIVREMFADRERIEEMMKRVGGFGTKTDVHNKIDALFMLLDQNIPALLDAIEQMVDERMRRLQGQVQKDEKALGDSDE
jgi:hypothetical protein